MAGKKDCRMGLHAGKSSHVPRNVSGIDVSQALIDFDGWRRWKGSDTKDLGETKRGFTVGPQLAAKSLASRLKIERKPSNRTPIRADSLPGPEINVETATPEVVPEDTVSSTARADAVVNQLSQMSIGGTSETRSPTSTESEPATAIPRASSLPAIHEDTEISSPEISTADAPPILKADATDGK